MVFSAIECPPLFLVDYPACSFGNINLQSEPAFVLHSPIKNLHKSHEGSFQTALIFPAFLPRIALVFTDGSSHRVFCFVGWEGDAINKK